MDLSNHVIVPSEEFSELQSLAWGTPTTLGDRVAGTVQTLIVFAAASAAFTAAAWASAVCKDWAEERRSERQTRELETKFNMHHASQ